MGLPVIATRHGGIPEAVTENLNGFLSDEGDTQSLGRSMVALANSPELYARFAAAAREAVAENFDQEMTIRELERTYEEVCDRRVAREPTVTDRIRFANEVAAERVRHVGPRSWPAAIAGRIKT